jgi:hypothetical protein
MAANITVTRWTTEEIATDKPNLATDFENNGIVAMITLESARAKATMVYELANGKYRFVLGSRALYRRWRRQR